MRLKLVIKRHSLPDTPVAWAIETSNNPTIAQLLEQVNEILPLESGGDWGLEDYAVEIHGSRTNFECLHFQQVSSILHEDDEVIIRPLLSLDLKLRRVSGRTQITSDGRHLFDGAAFGRAPPRAVSDRPMVDIPPRKRRRITYNEESDSTHNKDHFVEDQLQITEDEAGNRQLVVRANFDDDDDDDDDESKDDSDFQPEEEDGDEDMNSDLEELLSEGSEGSEQSKKQASDSEDSLAHITDENMHAKIQKLRDSFPEAPVTVCKHVLVGSDGDLSGAWEALSRAFSPAKLQKDIAVALSTVETPLSKNTRFEKVSTAVESLMVMRNDSDGYALSKGKEDTQYSAQNLVEHYDQHGLPPGSISTEATSSLITEMGGSKRKKKFHDSTQTSSRAHRSISTRNSAKSVWFEDVNNVVQKSDEFDLNDDEENEDEEFESSSSSGGSNSSSDLSSDLTEDNTSSSGCDSNGSDNDCGDKAKGTSSSSSSSTGSEPEETFSKQANRAALKSNSSTVATEVAEIATTERQVPKAPGSGKPATRKRNIRRRMANEMKRLKSRGSLLVESMSPKFKKTCQEGLATSLVSVNEPEKRIPMTTKVAEIAAAKQAEFMTRRNELLSSLVSGGVEVGPTASSGTTSAVLDVQITDTSQMTKVISKKIHRRMYGKEGPTSPEHLDGEDDVTDKPQDSTVMTPANSTLESTPGLRRKLNIGAAGRLVFGALGVRTPKTKADEEQVRRDLMKHVRPVEVVSVDAEMLNNAETPQTEQDPDAWRNVITLRAVECCHDGLVLSEPPFPFVQRWDVQQQGNWHRTLKHQKNKGKRQQRDQAQYYDDEQYVAKKLKYCEKFIEKSYEPYPSVGQDKDLDVGNTKIPNHCNIESDGVGGEANDQLMKDAQAAANTTNELADWDDLPELPDNISTVGSLLLGDLKVGMVVAYKQLILSEETNWQPQMSNYRTAQVTNISDNGQLDLVLAWRDRESKYYSEDTGQRIFGKFDVPIDDEHDDDGFLSVTFSELLEPKLVQAPLDTLAIVLDPLSTKAKSSINESITMDREDHEKTGMDRFETAEPEGEHFALAEQLLEPELPTVEVDNFTFNIAAAQAENEEIDDEVEDSYSTSIRGGDLQHLDSSPPALAISKNNRAKASMMMKEAGPRSDVVSSIVRVLTQRSIQPETPSQNGPEVAYEFAGPPRFNGFCSNPPSSPPVEIIPSSSAESNNTSQLSLSVPHEIEELDVVEEIEDVHSVSSAQYPKLSVPTSFTSLIADYGRQPDFPTPGDDTLERFEADHLLPEQNSLEKQSQPTGGDHILPLSSTRPLANILLSSDEEFSSIEEALATQPSRNQLNAPKKRMISSTAPVVSTDWPTSRSLVGATENMSDSYQEAMDLLDAKFNDEEEDPSQISPIVSPESLKFQLPKAEFSSQPWRAPNKNDRGGSNVCQKSQGLFILPRGSQQVDLTLSSDVEHEPDSDRDREGDALYKDLHGDLEDLPTGFGWVAKTPNRAQSQYQARRQSNMNLGLFSQSETKMKSTRKKTTSRF